MDHGVSPPNTGTLPWPIGIAMNRVSVSNSVRVTDGANPVSLHTTDTPTGAPGPQRYDVTLTANGNTQALVTMRLSGEMFDNANVAIQVTGGGISESWAASTRGALADTRQSTVAVNGTLVLRIEVTAAVTPGPGSLFWDGFAATLYVDAYDVGRAAFNPYGTGCSGTISGGGVPVVDQDYTVSLDSAAPGALAILIAGQSRTQWQFLPLPLPLDYLGATGCFVNAAPDAQVERTVDAAGHADVTFRLTRFTQDPTLWLQWVVFDPAAPGGLVTTRGAELRW
jgi:hypothetical protein